METYEPPKQYTKKNIIFWSEHYKSLNVPEGKARQIKARKFIEKDCIEWDADMGEFRCKPILGYNKTTYRLKKIGSSFNCSCQFYCKTGNICSHILALFMWLKIKNSQGDEKCLSG